jgi:hypothetical protein
VTFIARLGAVALLCTGAYSTPGGAQTTPAPANPQNPSTQGLQAGVAVAQAPAFSAASGTDRSVPTIQGSASIASSSRRGPVRSAGRGLPGMPGGPPIKESLGYRDPASRYMRPPVIGPLFCDPLRDEGCD